jgi:hypothetical protein
VTSEAKANPIITACTMISAWRNMPQGDRFCGTSAWSVAAGAGLGTGGAPVVCAAVGADAAAGGPAVPCASAAGINATNNSSVTAKATSVRRRLLGISRCLVLAVRLCAAPQGGPKMMLQCNIIKAASLEFE